MNLPQIWFYERFWYSNMFVRLNYGEALLGGKALEENFWHQGSSKKYQELGIYEHTTKLVPSSFPSVSRGNSLR